MSDNNNQIQKAKPSVKKIISKHKDKKALPKILSIVKDIVQVLASVAIQFLMRKK